MLNKILIEETRFEDRDRNFNMKQRAVIKFNAKLGKSAETFRLMQQVYGSQPV